MSVLDREPLSQNQLASLTKRLMYHYDVQAVVIMAVNKRGDLLTAIEGTPEKTAEMPMLLRRSADEIDRLHPWIPDSSPP